MRAIEALAPAGLELVEEPVHGVEALRAVRDRVAVRVAMDETARLSGSLTAKVADAVCLKVSRCGGISGLLAQAALVRASGADVYVASTFDGPLGIAAAVHCAAALRPSAASGLGTLEFFEDEFDVLSLEDGAIAVPAEARARRLAQLLATGLKPRPLLPILHVCSRARCSRKAAGASRARCWPSTPGSSPSSWPRWASASAARAPTASSRRGLPQALILLSAAVCLLRATSVRRDRKAWLCASAALACWPVGDLYYYTCVAGAEDPPFPSPADAVWLCFYPVRLRHARPPRPGARPSLRADHLAGRPDRRALRRRRGRGGRLQPAGRDHGRRCRHRDHEPRLPHR